MSEKNNYNWGIAIPFLIVLILLYYLMSYPENKIKNELSYSEFMENIEIGNIKSRLSIECTVVHFEMKNTNVNINNQQKNYNELYYSSRINPKDMAWFINKMTGNGYQIEFLEPSWQRKKSLFSIYDYLRIAALFIFVIYIYIVLKIKEKNRNKSSIE